MVYIGSIPHQPRTNAYNILQRRTSQSHKKGNWNISLAKTNHPKSELQFAKSAVMHRKYSTHFPLVKRRSSLPCSLTSFTTESPSWLTIQKRYFSKYVLITNFQSGISNYVFKSIWYQYILDWNNLLFHWVISCQRCGCHCFIFETPLACIWIYLPLIFDTTWFLVIESIFSKINIYFMKKYVFTMPNSTWVMGGWCWTCWCSPPGLHWDRRSSTTINSRLGAAQGQWGFLCNLVPTGMVHGTVGH